ncbi:MAG: hypothetical protein RSF40_09595 [Oscillospiraceae bacterium]
MKYNITQIKQSLTIDDILLIMQSIGAYPLSDNGKEIVFNSICHNSESHKLWYYIETSSFYCWSKCQCSYDIFSLLQKVNNLSLVEAIEYVISVAKLPIETAIKTKSKIPIDDWQKDLKKFIMPENQTAKQELKIYDKEILQCFLPVYHQSWLNDNISIAAMKKYGIKFYPYNNQIIIPVFNADDELVGIHARNLSAEKIAKGYKYQPVKTLGQDYKFNTSNALYGLNVNKHNIELKQEVFLFESPKAVLQMETIMEYNCSVGLFGMNLSYNQRDMLLSLGATKVYICLDRQYTDFGNNDECIKWRKNILKIANKFKGFCDVFVVYDKEHMLDYKDSPSDKGEIVWNELYRKSEEIK